MVPEAETEAVATEVAETMMATMIAMIVEITMEAVAIVVAVAEWPPLARLCHTHQPSGPGTANTGTRCLHCNII